MLEGMLRTCVLDHKGRGLIVLSGIRLQQQFQASVRMAPYESWYGRPCRLPLCWTKVEESSITGPDLIRDTYEKVSLIR